MTFHRTLKSSSFMTNTPALRTSPDITYMVTLLYLGAQPLFLWERQVAQASLWAEQSLTWWDWDVVDPCHPLLPHMPGVGTQPGGQGLGLHVGLETRERWHCFSLLLNFWMTRCGLPDLALDQGLNTSELYSIITYTVILHHFLYMIKHIQMI